MKEISNAEYGMNDMVNGPEIRMEINKTDEELKQTEFGGLKTANRK